MKERTKATGKDASFRKRRNKEFYAVKFSKKFKPKTPRATSFGHICVSKADAQLLIELVNSPFKPNEATLEARRMNAAIPRLSR